MGLMKVRLGAADCKALGVPAEMPFDLARMRLSEVRALRTAGYADTKAFLASLEAEDLDAVFVLVWLACRRHGYTGAFGDLDFEIGDLDLDVQQPAGGEGLGEGDTPQAGEATPT